MSSRDMIYDMNIPASCSCVKKQSHTSLEETDILALHDRQFSVPKHRFSGHKSERTWTKLLYTGMKFVNLINSAQEI